MQWAMRDAERLLRNGKAGSVLVMEFDEMIPVFSQLSETGEHESLFAKALVLTRN